MMNDITFPKADLAVITLVIPAYEPSSALVDIVEQLSHHPFRSIVIVDDGSDQKSQTMFDQVAGVERVTLLRHEINRGKGAALKSAFRHICDNDAKHTRCIITLDADGQHKIKDIIAIAHECGTDSDKLVMGIRTFSEDIPLRSRFGNLLTRRVLRWTNKVDLQDTQTGLRCLPLSFAEQTLKIQTERYEFELECILLAKRVNLAIAQHPIQTVYIDDNASSHFRPLLDSLRIYLVFARFLMVSVGSFLLDIALFTLFYYATGHIIISTYAARLLSGSFNFYINKHVVFLSHNRRRYPRESFGYITLAVFIATLSGALVNWLTPLTGWHATLVKIVVDIQLFIISFLVQRVVVFRH